MQNQLYLLKPKRQRFQSEISSYVDIYLTNLLPVFKDIENKAENYSKELFENYLNQPADDNSRCLSSMAEESMERSGEYYLYLKLGLYQLTASWHSMLYQLWEQQVRAFLFREESRTKEIDYKSYCTKIEASKKRFSYYGIDLEKLSCWTCVNGIDELRLLCNVIKHCEGDSEAKLRDKNPNLFVKDNFGDHLELHKTTLSNETLNINEVTIQNYKEALLSFWDEIPERNYKREMN